MISGIIKVSVLLFSAESKVEANNTYRDLDYSGHHNMHKTETKYCFVI